MGRYIPTYIPTTTTPPKRRIDDTKNTRRGKQASRAPLSCLCTAHTHTATKSKDGWVRGRGGGKGKRASKTANERERRTVQNNHHKTIPQAGDKTREDEAKVSLRAQNKKSTQPCSFSLLVVVVSSTSSTQRDRGRLAGHALDEKFHPEPPFS